MLFRSVKSILVSTDKKTIYDLATIVNSCNLDIIDITTTGLVDYYNFKSKELDTKNIAIVNLGSTTTNISIFSKGIFINNKIIDDGGFYIDKEIAAKYNLKRNETEYLKEKLALAVINNADEKETITLTLEEDEVEDKVEEDLGDDESFDYDDDFDEPDHDPKYDEDIDYDQYDEYYKD